MNDIFSTAQAAADDYLTSIKAANVSMEEEQKAAEKEQMLNGADEKRGSKHPHDKRDKS